MPPQPSIPGLLRFARNDGDDSAESERAQATLLKTSANLLGLLRQTRSERQALALSDAQIDAAEIDAIIAERAQAARAARNWAESDRLRDHLAALGVAIKDNKDGATTWEIKR